MIFTNLRLIGFKSFVDTTDLDIRNGLTGVVGPNGCGKSNLLEALRWVMGATSAKALRSSGMSDVIFSGTSMRPARNWAEVVLTLDNSDRSAPAEYNECAVIEISRRIVKHEEGAQSIYRINSKEVRAKDVQLLFADASTGANSPALVRQGQISELINAKPENRRRLLEEAAGITGLHSRRHEAELRLRAAEQNLSRLDDVTGELESQKSALARQARQATRYRNLSGDIRKAEAGVALARWTEATGTRDTCEQQVNEVRDLVEETARASAAAMVAATDAQEQLDPLRQGEAAAGAALHRLTVAGEGLEDEAQRAAAELKRLDQDIESASNDFSREKELNQDADNALEHIARETENLKTREAAETQRLQNASNEQTSADRALAEEESKFEAVNARYAENEAQRRAIEAAINAAEHTAARTNSNIAALEEERARIQPNEEQSAKLSLARETLHKADLAAQAAEQKLAEDEEKRSIADENLRRLTKPKDEAARAFAELKAECDALERVLGAQGTADWPALIEAVKAADGYETALAAALGDDLDAALDQAAPAFWSDAQSTEETADLPAGAAPLWRYVTGPEQIRLRLMNVGIVDRDAGGRLVSQLSPGQRLVSREGDLWRWDGFVKRAEAKTAAAIRLEQRNRLTHLADDLQTAREHAEVTGRQYQEALNLLNDAQAREKSARTDGAQARRSLDAARNALSAIEREHERASSRLTAIAANLETAAAANNETAQQIRELTEKRGALPEAARLAEEVANAREAVSAARNSATEARAAHRDLAREADMRTQRLAELARESGVWRARGQTANARIIELRKRIDASTAARENAAGAPEAIEAKRTALLTQLGEAEAQRKFAADALSAAVTASEDAARTARDAEAAASDAREGRARLDAQLESALARVEEAAALAREACNAEPADLPGIFGLKEGDALPLRSDLERKLERYKRERENLGGVNLRADEELEEIKTRLDDIESEREDCEAAIRKLRAAIGSINREARDRLKSAFETVNQNFSRLFTRLFNGGQAELRLIESEDVLEAGLEIYASPPGKKLTSMSLMSGGEQALTATALIFAVFMANPAPVCVLDEVDAPLDDANTERFCRLLHEMAKETETRFLVITHHALTMSRMDRLFGVTMMERGVSQLVSVDLQKAEQLAAAE